MKQTTTEKTATEILDELSSQTVDLRVWSKLQERILKVTQGEPTFMAFNVLVNAAAKFLAVDCCGRLPAQNEAEYQQQFKEFAKVVEEMMNEGECTYSDPDAYYELRPRGYPENPFATKA